MTQINRAATRATLILRLLLAFLFLAAALWPAVAQTDSRVSNLFEYRGYSRPLYDRWTRTSEYIVVRDGTKLAADIFRPSGAVEPMPVIWMYERYLRATVREGTTIVKLDRELWLREMVRHGYVVAIVDARGTGASFGTWDGPFGPREADDVYDLTEWFAAQPWSNQRVGMFGRSYMAVVQLMAAGVAPPHLKAIFPEMAAYDLYSTVYSGGIYRQPLVNGWSDLIKQSDASSLAAPVDSDKDGALLAKAIEEHRQNRDFASLCASMPFRNSADSVTESRFFITREPSRYLEGVNRSGVAVYLLAGWHDVWARDAFVWFKNLNVPRRLVVGPWSHRRSDGFNAVSEHLRWFDYWLKGIDNGIKDEFPIAYYTTNASSGSGWRLASNWPLAETQQTAYYFHEGKSGSINSVNDGLLDASPPNNETGSDMYQVDYSTSSGPATRWTDLYEGSFGYLDMASNDRLALTYTTPPLSADVEVTGHPVVRLWISSDTPEADIFVYLEDVSEGGVSQYVSEGALKSSHHAVRDPHFDFLGLPYHRSLLEDHSKFIKKPTELAFDLFPVSYVFERGHRLRISITGADKDNAATPKRVPAPAINLLRNRQFPSYVVLPVIPAAAERRELPLPSNNPSGIMPVAGSAASPFPRFWFVALFLALLVISSVLAKRFVRSRGSRPGPF